MGKQQQRFLILAQDHFSSLLLARNLMLGNSKSNGPIISFKQKVELTKKMFDERLIIHFKAEEKIIFPIVKQYAMHLESEINEFIEDHYRIEDIIESLSSTISIRRRLHDFGQSLEAHILHEEKVINQQLLVILPPDIFDSLELELNNYYESLISPKK